MLYFNIAFLQAEMMRVTCDFHMHTRLSDGHCSAADLVDEAKRRGLERIAVTDHAFIGLSKRMSEDDFAKQGAYIASLDSGHTRVLHGVEANILSGGRIDAPSGIIRATDVLIAGFHNFPGLARGEDRKFVFVNGYLPERERRKLKEENTLAICAAVRRYPIDILAHPGHRLPIDFAEVCKTLKECGAYFELNERHLADINGIDDGMRDILASGVNFILGSDAHRAKDVGKFTYVESFISRFGIRAERIYGAEGNLPAFRDKKEWSDEL